MGLLSRMPRSPKQPLTQAEVRTLITKYGLDDHKKLILDGLRRSVRLKPGKPVKRRLPTGTSKFGGEPDLPEGVAWPEFEGRPLHFIAQLNLADLPPRWIPSADLPRKGLLSFWFDTIGWARCAFGPQPQPFRILYLTTPTSRHPFPELDDSINLEFGPWRPFPERRVAMKPSLTISEDTEYDLSNRLWDAGIIDDEQFEFQAALGGQDLADYSDQPHQLLGSHRFPQADGREDAAQAELGYTGTTGYDDAGKKKVARRKRAWRLLLLLDSDQASDWMWSDAGSLSFWIRDTDLKKRRFDRIYGEVESA